VKLVLLDAFGSPRGGERVLFARASGVTSDAVEVAAAGAAGRIGIAWVSRAGDRLEAMATHGSATGEAFAPPESLGAVDAIALEPGRARGLLAAAAAADGNVGILHRREEEQCPSGESSEGERCVGFSMHRLGGSPGGSGRSGVGLIAPSPCDRGVVGYVWSAGVWYYGVCTMRGGRQATTVYAIQPDPEYAHAERVLDGCEPLAIAAVDRGAVITGRCGEARGAGARIAAVELLEAAQRRRDLHATRGAILCEDGHPAVMRTGDGAPIARVLSGPSSGLEAFLPEELAPAGARAVWTGDALLVAHPVAGEGVATRVVLGRYQCVGSGLVRTDVP
jgi:hypothetical protein